MDAALLAPVRRRRPVLPARGPAAGPHPLNSLPEMQRDNGNVVGLALTFVPDERVRSRNCRSQPKAQLTRAMQPGHA